MIRSLEKRIFFLIVKSHGLSSDLPHDSRKLLKIAAGENEGL